MSRPLTPVLLVALMCAAVTVVYAGRLSGPPVFDDHESILGNASIQALRLPDVLRPPRETPVAGRPLPNLTFALNHALTGNEPGPLHATNLLFHLLAVALAFGLVRATLAHGRVPERLRAGAGPLAFATALLFAVHPVAVEIVLYATQRTEGLVAIFYLAALLVLARAAARGHTHPSHVAAMLACALCGALSKEVFVTAPLLALFYDRAFFAGSFVQALRARAKLYAALVVSWPALFALQRTAPRPVSVRAFELEYLLAQGEIVLGYLRLAFVPLHPVFDYGPLLPQKLGVIWPYLAITGGLLAVGTWLALARPRLGFVAACFFGVLAPSSGLLSIFPEVGAERRVYLPLVALLAYAVVAIASALRSQTLQRVLLVVVTCGFALCARVQAGNYASELQVWRSSVSARPGNPRAHFHLGDELHEQGSLSNAERELRTAIALKPNYRDAYVSLAEVLGEQGRGDEAVRALRTALSFDPDYTRPGARLPPKRTHVEARAALVLQLVELGRLDEARAALAWLTRVVPNDSHTRTLRERLRQAEQARLPQLAARAWNAAPPFGPAGQWLGADSAYSVELDARHVLWLFGDTFLDPRADGHRTDGPAFFIRNSVAIQTGADAETAHDLSRATLTYHWGPSDAHGVPSSFFHDYDGATRWLWPMHGVRLPSGELLLFRLHLQAAEGGFGFAVLGSDAVAIDDPTLPPNRWQPRVVLPLMAADATPPVKQAFLLGASVLIHGEHLYVYAAHNDDAHHTLYLARVALASLRGLPAGALDDPEWWCGAAQGFRKRSQGAEPSALFPDAQIELSVSYVDKLARFVEIQTQGGLLGDPSAAISARFALQPEGPWSTALPFYRPVEARRADAANLLAYAAKAHPEQRGADLVISYVVNDLKRFPPDDSLYYPRLLRVSVPAAPTVP